MGGRRTLLVLGAVLLAAGCFATPAQATFHLIKVREVYPGSVAAPDSGYVELQMYSSGQQFVKNHAVTVYDAEGSLVGTFAFPSNVANGANQQTILVGDSGVQSAFGVAPDLVDSGFALGAAGGAACWDSTLDCVSWGGFTGSTPSASGSPADPLGIPDGKALRRTIAPGCSTLLEGADDSNDSATDFSDVTPQPRNDASAIVEHACVAPTATIDSKPANPSKSTSAGFTYHSTPAGAEFECKLDLAAYAACAKEGIVYPGPLADGSHTFQVRAKSEEGGTGTAASYSWKVDTVAPTVTIDTHPEDPSSGAAVGFAYHASETGSSFECSLALGAASDSFSSCASSGKTYTGLADGVYTFKVRAKDAAGNLGSPTGFEWTVENTVPDTTPPDTAIDSAPPDPSTSSVADFAYHSTEPESSFECKLDGAAFAPCAASGIEYTGLAEGAHSFEVRATDASENTDPTPAGYSFEVVLALPAPPPLAPEEPEAGPGPPNTRIVAGPRRRTRDRTPTLRFRASVGAVASFQCKLDRKRFRGCRSPYTTGPLRRGRHVIRVRAVFLGAFDPTPARVVFRVVGGPRRKHARHRR